MAESFLIYPKQRDKLDPSLNRKVVAFFDKLTTNDESPGLHIEPINNSADPRARTGRVDQQYRALLFKITGDMTAYVVHGIYNHDDAYKKAETATLTINPINGLPDFAEVTPAPKQQTPPQPSDYMASPVAAAPLIEFSAEDLIVSLGLPPEVAETAVALTSKEAVSLYAQELPEWQGLAILLLADKEPISNVAEELQILRDAPAISDIEEARAAFGKPAEVSDQELLDSFDKPAAQMSFAKIKGEEELRRVITDGDFGSWRIFLHPQQRQWVQRDWNGPYRISGGAGTGKTVVVVHRARRLAAADPEAPIVLTTFTTNLADELGRSLERLDPTVARADQLGGGGVFVGGIDALASAVLRSAGTDVGEAVARVLGAGRTDINGRTGPEVWKSALITKGDALDPALRRVAFLQAEYEMVVLPNHITQLKDYLRVPRTGRGVRLARAARRAVWEVIEQYRSIARQDSSIDFAEAATIAAAHLRLTNSHPARHVLVDEGQDFKPCHWQLVRALTAEQPNDIFIAEDAHQRIYGQKLVLSHYDIHTRGRSRGLRLNYRTTAENLAWAVGVLQGQSVVDSEGELESMTGYLSARSGSSPRLEELPSLSAELDFAAHQVNEWVNAGDVAPETIAVLTRDRTGRDRVASGLAERGVEIRVLEAGSVRGGAPVVLTMHRAKGTEFTKVLLFGLSRDSIPMGLQNYDFDENELTEATLRERSLLYVAASRARDELVATYSGQKSFLLPAGN